MKSNNINCQKMCNTKYPNRERCICGATVDNCVITECNRMCKKYGTIPDSSLIDLVWYKCVNTSKIDSESAIFCQNYPHGDNVKKYNKINQLVNESKKYHS